MTDRECAKTLRRGLDKYLENSMYVPGFADALRHAISELERTETKGIIAADGPVSAGGIREEVESGGNWMMDRFMQVR